jgi:BASS family bile acid:Na+ symporter
MIDNVTLNFNQSSVWILNIVLAIIMFGIALDLKIARFKSVAKNPKALFVGLSTQWIMLPLLTLGLIWIFRPIPSMALGMILVACCPGGNISNFISAICKADVELSIVLTTISSLGAVILTPILFNFYGSIFPDTKNILLQINLDWMQVGKAISIIIIIPILLGKLVSSYFPNFAKKIKAPLRYLSMLLFLLIVIGALMVNGSYFLEYIDEVFSLVLFHNGAAFLIAFLIATVFKLKKNEIKSVTIETGIQNSGLGLLIIFSFFSGLGGMAIIAAWWGVWHIVSGFTLGFFWRNETN